MHCGGRGRALASAPGAALAVVDAATGSVGEPPVADRMLKPHSEQNAEPERFRAPHRGHGAASDDEPGRVMVASSAATSR